MTRKTPPHKAYPEWTEARYRQFIRSALRSAWNRWPPKYEALNKARRIVEGQRHKYEYQCNKCKQWFKQKGVQVDHISSAGSDSSWDNFIDRLFVGVDKLQVLCRPCHQDKTNKERKA